MNKFECNDCDQFEECDECNEIIKKTRFKIKKLRSNQKYPHGNGIFGFALAYLEASKEINIEWSEYIYTWTVLGYKKVFPHHATDYIQYKEDIEKSSLMMSQIIHKLKRESKKYADFFYHEWVREINSYLQENNIIIDDNIVFRPPEHKHFKIQDEDGIGYFRITKSDLEQTDDDEEFDFMFHLKDTD